MAGVSEAFGTSFLNKERFEALAAWLQLPELLKIAESGREEARALSTVEARVVEACKAVEDAGYKLELYLDHARAEDIEASGD